jgi:hypothetical protein
MRVIALAMLVAMLPGCFGYNRPAKRWSYVGNTVLILGGGGAIAADTLGGSAESGMTVTAADPYEPPFSGLMLAGVILVAAGFFGMIFNATRPIVKTSR